MFAHYISFHQKHIRVTVKFYCVPCSTRAELRLKLWCWLNSLSMWSNERGPEDCWRVQGRILCGKWAVSPSSTSLKWSSYVHFTNGLLEGISPNDQKMFFFFQNNHLNSAPFLQWAKLQFGKESCDSRESLECIECTFFIDIEVYQAVQC